MPASERVTSGLFAELLAPAGDLEALRAAINNGANAVYFGLDDFNARHRATNFTLESLPETMRLLRSFGVRGYVTFNTLVFAGELERAAEYLAAIARAGVDAVIVQDLGLVTLIRELAPSLAIHGSTQMTLTDASGVEFVRELGVERVILARELSIAEIGRIAQETSTEIEVFVHGALCVAYSGQCLTSEALGGRSANRGQCAQACRQPYELIVDGQPRDLGEQAYLLSPKDLAAWDLVPELLAAGVCSLKIEGRLKSPQYVAMTTATYREALEAARAGRRLELTESQQTDLAQSFSRGFTSGFLKGIDHQELVEGRFPKHRGVFVGQVRRIQHDRVIVSRPSPGPLVELKPGDGVVFDQGHPEQDEQGGRIFEVEALGDADRSLALAFGSGDVNLRGIAVGARVWRTDDPRLRKRLEQTYAPQVVVQRVPVTVRVCASAGDRLRLELVDPDGVTARVETPEPVAAAIRHPLTTALAEQQLGRLGGTPFTLGGVELRELGGGDSAETGPQLPVPELPVMVPKSVLNQIRREAVDLLQQLRLERRSGHAVDAGALARLRSAIAARHGGGRPEGQPAAGATLSVLCRTREQWQAALDWKPRQGLGELEWIYCDFEDVRQYAEVVAESRRRGRRLGLATPRILKPTELGLLKQLQRLDPDAILVRNLAAISGLRSLGYAGELKGDYSLNVTNELTAALFVERGLSTLVPGYDLNLEQLLELLARFKSTQWELVIHQHIPMFHMEHCVFSHVLSNGKDHHDCGRPCEAHRVELRDHVGESHPLVADIGCRNTVFRDHAQSGIGYVSQLTAAGVGRFRVELLRENATQAESLLNDYSRAVAGEAVGLKSGGQLTVLGQIGITRGTLEHD
jgi:putative protease